MNFNERFIPFSIDICLNRRTKRKIYLCHHCARSIVLNILLLSSWRDTVKVTFGDWFFYLFSAAQIKCLHFSFYQKLNLLRTFVSQTNCKLFFQNIWSLNECFVLWNKLNCLPNFNNDIECIVISIFHSLLFQFIAKQLRKSKTKNKNCWIE